ncbi:MAG: ATP-binding protein [Bacteroidota bacterium]
MHRTHFLNAIKETFQQHPICGILGPRQCGKTTLAKQFVQTSPQRKVHFFDLENPFDLGRLDNPMLTLAALKGTVVIDEIQRRPDLFLTLRVLADTTSLKFLILGSASRQLIEQSSESLAGRIGYLELTPFTLREAENITELWIRGGFPKAYLANTSRQSVLWRNAYIRTFLEQDIPNLGIKIPPKNLHRFWMMLAHYHGQLFQASELGRSLSVSHHTTKKYLDILEGTFMMRTLQPWHENIAKRQVKTVKVYFRDTGIFHTLLGINDKTALERHPKLGASWEGFALEELLRYYQVPSEQAYFWRTQTGAELDLLIHQQGVKRGFEFKYTERPKITPSMRIALKELKLDQVTIVYPGPHSYALDDHISVMSIEALQAGIA